jgi:peptidoglycan DL-endopeptidase CwlO
MTSFRAARRFVLLTALILVATVALPGAAAASGEPRTEADRLLAVANSEVGSRYAWAATGPTTFDCSGLVYYAFREAGVLDRIGGKRRTVAGLHTWFRNNGTISRTISTARPGDILIWGSDKHTGIYVGNNYAISALVNPYGVRLHRVDKISLRLTAVLHVDLQR